MSYCKHEDPKEVAFRGLTYGVFVTGGRKRLVSVGGSAYGIPAKRRTLEEVREPRRENEGVWMWRSSS